MSKKRKRSTVVKQLDQVFSQYIRRRNANLDGFVECVTCGNVRHWKQMQAGHFMSRRKYSTRWDEMNVQVQDDACNRWRQGEQYKFALWLDENYGEGTADKLVLKSNQQVKYSTEELEEMIEDYKAKLAEL